MENLLNISGIHTYIVLRDESQELVCRTIRARDIGQILMGLMPHSDTRATALFFAKEWRMTLMPLSCRPRGAASSFS